MAKALFLSEADRDLLRGWVRELVYKYANNSPASADPGVSQSPERYIAKTPEAGVDPETDPGGLPARVGTTVGRAKCRVYSLEPDDIEDLDGDYILTPVMREDDEPVEVDVFNIYLLPRLPDTYIEIRRDKYGRWLAAPAVELYGFPDDDIDLDATGVISICDINKVDLEIDVEAKAMASSLLAGKLVVVGEIENGLIAMGAEQEC